MTHVRRLICLLVTMLVALAGVGLVAPAAQASSTESAFVSAINSARASAGASALSVKSDLTSVARAQASRMASSQNLYHTPNLGSAVKNWTLVGENVGYGPDVSTIHRAFMGSAPHRANILDSRFREVGVGAVVVNGTIWVAEVFRRPATSTASPTPSASRAPASKLVTSKPRTTGTRPAAVAAAKAAGSSTAASQAAARAAAAKAAAARAAAARLAALPEGVVCTTSPQAARQLQAAVAAHRTARLVEQAQRTVLGFQCGQQLPLTGVVDLATRRALGS